MAIASASLAGRLEERRALLDWRRRVRDGAHATLVIRGEAGIGKSTLLAQLRSATDGVAVAVGRGLGDTPVPYSALREWLTTLAEHPAAGAERTVLVELRDRAEATPTTDTAALHDRQARAHTAVAGIVRRLLDTAPLLLLVDDGHWVDESSAALLAHLTRSLPSTRYGFGVALATRPLDATSPLHRVVHDAAADAIDLDGLPPLVAAQLVNNRWGWHAPSATAVRLCQITGGNPLALITTVEAGLRTGALAVDGDELVIAAPTQLVAADIDADVGERLSRLSPGTRAWAEIAAVWGSDVPIRSLRSLPLDDDRGNLDDAIDDLVDAGLLNDGGSTVRFRHPRVRAGVLAALTPRRRATLHAQIGAVEVEAGNIVLAAHHYELAGRRVDPATLAEVAEEAGIRCTTSFGWSDAARFFSAAVQAREQLDGPIDGELLHRLAVAEYFAYDSDRCRQHAEDAALAHRAGGDTEAWGQAAILATRVALVRRPHESVGRRLDHSDLRDWLDHAPDDHPTLRATALAQLAQVHMAESDPERAFTILQEAEALAHSVADDELASTLAFSTGLNHLGVYGLDAAREAFHRARAGAITDVRRFSATVRLGLLDLVGGDTARTVNELTALLTTHARSGFIAEQSLASAVLAATAAATGAVDAIAQHGRDAIERFDQSGYAYSPLLAYPALAAGRTMAGDLDGAIALIDTWEAARGADLAPWRWLVSTIGGDADDVARVAAALASVRTLRRRRDVRTLNASWRVGCQLELAVAHDRPDLAADMLDDVRWLDDAGVRFLPGWPFFVPRLRAIAEAFVGNEQEAAAAFRRASSLATAGDLRAEPHRIAIDRVRVGLADDADAGRAAVALDLAGLAGLVPVAVRRPDAPAGIRIVAFCDLVSSTSLNVRVGDSRFADLIDEVTETLRQGLRATGGVEFKHTGDGMAAWFTSPVAAIAWAGRVIDELERISTAHPDERLELSIGLSAGEPVDRSGDLFGVAVSTAARLCDAAEAGEILVADEVRRIASGQGIDFDDAGTRSFKGFPEPVRTHRVRRVDSVV